MTNKHIEDSTPEERTRYCLEALGVAWTFLISNVMPWMGKPGVYVWAKGTDKFPEPIEKNDYFVIANPDKFHKTNACDEPVLIWCPKGHPKLPPEDDPKTPPIKYTDLQEDAVMAAMHLNAIKTVSPMRLIDTVVYAAVFNVVNAREKGERKLERTAVTRGMTTLLVCAGTYRVVDLQATSVGDMVASLRENSIEDELDKLNGPRPPGDDEKLKQKQIQTLQWQLDLKNNLANDPLTRNAYRFLKAIEACKTIDEAREVPVPILERLRRNTPVEVDYVDAFAKHGLGTREIATMSNRFNHPVDRNAEQALARSIKKAYRTRFGRNAPGAPEDETETETEDETETG